MRVLFVDDDQAVAQSVEMALRQKGHACETADMGERALSLAKNHEYDIIVLDVGLPDVDGDQVARRMKLEGITTPLLLQSGIDDPTLATEAREAGAEGFLPKPFSIADLIDRMEVVLGLPSSAAAEPKVERAASREEVAPEAKAPTEKPAAAAASPQDDPPQRPSAVAEARAALRAQPETPTRLQAASGVMAEGGAKALSKARAALAAQRDRTKSPSAPDGETADGPDDAAGLAVPGGVKALAEPVARVRAAFGEKPLSKATCKARDVLRAKLPSRRKAADESDAGPGDGDLDADRSTEDGNDAPAGLGLAARARAALDANPLTQAMAKTRTALKEKRGSRAAVDPEAEPVPEPVPEADLPPQLKPEFWSEPETQDAPTAQAELETDEQPESVKEPELGAGGEAPVDHEPVDHQPVDHEPCGPTPGAAPASHPETESEGQVQDLGRAQEPLEADTDGVWPSSAPAPGPDVQAELEPAAAASREAQEQDKPAPEAESQTQPETKIEGSPPKRADAQESTEPDPGVGAPAGAAMPLSEPRPEAASTTASSPEATEQDKQEVSPDLAPNLPDRPVFQSETEIEGLSRAAAEVKDPVRSEPSLGSPTGFTGPDPEQQPQSEAQSTDEPGPDVAELGGQEAPADPVPSMPDRATFESEPEGADRSPASAEAETPPRSESDSDVLTTTTAPGPKPQRQPEAASPDESNPEIAEQLGEEAPSDLAPQDPDGPATESEMEVVDHPPVPAEADSSPTPAPDLGAPTGVTATDSGQQFQSVVESIEETDPEAADQADASNRRHDRKGTIKAAVIDDGKNQIPCVIVDLSESGARLLLLDTDQQCPWRFLLVPVEGPEHRCVRRWRDGDNIGVEFEEPEADDGDDTDRPAQDEEAQGEEPA